MKLSRKSAASILLVLIGVLFASINLVFAAEQQSGNAAPDPIITGCAFLAAALSTGLSAVAAGIAVAHVGAAAVGAISEKPEMAGRALIFVGLAEGIAIYGLIIAIMILGKVKI